MDWYKCSSCVVVLPGPKRLLSWIIMNTRSAAITISVPISSMSICIPPYMFCTIGKVLHGNEYSAKLFPSESIFLCCNQVRQRMHQPLCCRSGQAKHDTIINLLLATDGFCKYINCEAI